MLSRLFVVLSLLTCTGWCQELWIYPPNTPADPADTAAIKEQARHLDQGNFPAARDACLRVADKNAGTAFGAEALFGAHYAQLLNGDEAGAEATRQKIIDQYPSSRFEIRARCFAVDAIAYNAGAEERLTLYSSFLEELGAPRLDEILTGEDLEQAILQVRSFHPEMRLALASVYDKGISMSESPEQAVNVASFCRQAFGTNVPVNIEFTHSLQMALKEWRGKKAGGQSSLPSITVVSPEPGDLVGVQPTIAVRITTGDYRNDPVALDSLSFKVSTLR